MHVPRKANDDDCRFRIICTARNPGIPCNYPLFRIFLSLLSTHPTSFLLRKLFILFGKYMSYYFHFSHWLTEKNVVKLLFLFLMSFSSSLPLLISLPVYFLLPSLILPLIFSLSFLPSPSLHLPLPFTFYPPLPNSSLLPLLPLFTFF